MEQTIYILGRQPALGLAELESLCGHKNIQPFGDQAALLINRSQQVDFNRLGGSLKTGQVIASLPTKHWGKIVQHLTDQISDLARLTSGGKIKLGLSVHQLQVSPTRLNATGLELKKQLRNDGYSVRVVPNRTAELNAAQTLNNQLIGGNGLELMIVGGPNQTIIARTTDVQDIDAYAARDHGRPMRDAQVGMLPPKLAQIIINLAVGQSHTISTSVKPIIIDPFCGTGVLLQEALLMGYSVSGSDISPKMINYTQQNLDWLQKKQPPTGSLDSLTVADATEHNWPQLTSTSAIAGETYLGRPFSSPPNPETLQKVAQDVDTIHKKFLQNIARQTQTGFRMCIAVPAWHTNSGRRRLKTLDYLESMGYNRVSFAHSEDQELVYHRPNQIVGRELVTLVRT